MSNQFMLKVSQTLDKPTKNQPTTFKRCAGFSLFELMIAIAIIAILTAIALPTYQRYIKKAAMTELLQVSAPYRTAVEICSIEQGDLKNCQAGKNGIPADASTQYIKQLTVQNGVIEMVGQASLAGLSVTLSPQTQTNQSLQWQKSCTSEDEDLVDLCQDMFKF